MSAQNAGPAASVTNNVVTLTLHPRTTAQTNGAPIGSDQISNPGRLYISPGGALAQVNPQLTGYVVVGASAMRQRALSRQSLKRSIQPIFAQAGDSFAKGTGASAGNGYTNFGFQQMLEYSMGMSVNPGNYGRAGFPLSQYSGAGNVSGSIGAYLSRVPYATDSITACIVGLNDMRGIGQAGGVNQTGMGPNPDNWVASRSKIMAAMSRMMIPAAARGRMLASPGTRNPNFTWTGTWSYASVNSNPETCSTQSGTASVSGTTAFGNLIFLVFSRDVAATTAYLDITIDGVAYPRVFAHSQYDGWSQDCLVYRMPTNAAHSFTITATGATSGNAIVLESIDCVDDTTDFSGNLVYSTPLPLTDATSTGWSSTGVSANGANANSATGATAWLYNNGSLDRWASIVHDVAKDMFEMGFNVMPVFPQKGFDLYNNNMISSADNIHPNDLGHQHIYQAFSQVVKPLAGA